MNTNFFTHSRRKQIK